MSGAQRWSSSGPFLALGKAYFDMWVEGKCIGHVDSTASHSSSPALTVLIPTRNRYGRLAALLSALRTQDAVSHEVILIDQSDHVPPPRFEDELLGRVTVLRMTPGNANAARNRGLRAAKGGVVLFLDDDVLPRSGDLLRRHLAWYEDPRVVSVGGQVLEPGAMTRGNRHLLTRIPRWGWLFFPMNYSRTARVWAVGGSGNLSVRRLAALECGGFDEQFRCASHFEETEFLFRALAMGGQSWFDPEASVVHFQDPEGGSRVAPASQKKHEDLAGVFYMLLRHARLVGSPLILLHLWAWRRLRSKCHQETPAVADYLRAFREARRRKHEGQLLMPRDEAPRDS